jgi:hypothetical protein
MHLMGVYLIGVYLMGVYLIGMYLMGIHLKGVAKSVGDPWGAIISKGWRCIMAALRILLAEAHPMDLRVGLPEPWRSIPSDCRSLGRRNLDSGSLDGRSLDSRSLDGRSLDGRSLDGRSLDSGSLDGRSLGP